MHLVITLLIAACMLSSKPATAEVVSWDRLSDSRVEGYTLHIGTTSGGDYHEANDVGNINHWVINPEAHPIYITVSAYGQGSTSGHSNEIVLFPKGYFYKEFHDDMDRDGNSDEIAVRYDGIYIVYGNSSESDAVQVIANNFSPSSGWDFVNKHVIGIADLNADGYPDIYGFGDNGLIVAYSIGGTSYQAPRTVLSGNFGYANGWRIERHIRGIADLNADGYPDIYGFGDNGLIVAYSIGGTSYQAPRTVLSGNFGYANGWRIERHIRGITYLNADGYADIYGFGDNGLIVAYSIGGTSYQAPRTVLSGNFGYANGWRIEEARRFVDINMDGHPDVLGWKDTGDLYFSISSGTSFGAVEVW